MVGLVLVLFLGEGEALRRSMYECMLPADLMDDVQRRFEGLLRLEWMGRICRLPFGFVSYCILSGGMISYVAFSFCLFIRGVEIDFGVVIVG